MAACGWGGCVGFGGVDAAFRAHDAISCTGTPPFLPVPSLQLLLELLYIWYSFYAFCLQFFRLFIYGVNYSQKKKKIEGRRRNIYIYIDARPSCVETVRVFLFLFLFFLLTALQCKSG